MAFLSGFFGKTIFQIEVSWITPPKVRELTVVGSNFNLIVDAVGQKIKKIDQEGKVSIIEVEENNTIKDELHGFIKYLLDSNYIHPASGKVGNRIVKIVSKALKECKIPSNK